MEKQEKPRLAEVLGVEEDAEWTVSGVPGGVYRVHSGVRQYKTSAGWLDCTNEGDLSRLINNPESIIRAPRLTEPENAIMRAVGARWVSRNGDSDYGLVELWRNKPICIEGNFDSGDGTPPIACILCSLFESVNPGDLVEVQE